MDHAKTTTGQYLSADEVREISRMMGELRDVTLSCRTHKTASAFIERFTGDKAASVVYGGLGCPPLPYDPG
jgi:hypothetical protein